MDISVVILNWNTRKLLEACLRSLQHSQPGIALEVLVVDNASEDDSREMVRSLFPEVRLICNPVNIGFGAGAELQKPLALAVIGGLSVSTFITLLVMPVLYSLLEQRAASRRSPGPSASPAPGA